MHADYDQPFFLQFRYHAWKDILGMSAVTGKDEGMLAADKSHIINESTKIGSLNMSIHRRAAETHQVIFAHTMPVGFFKGGNIAIAGRLPYSCLDRPGNLFRISCYRQVDDNTFHMFRSPCYIEITVLILSRPVTECLVESFIGHRLGREMRSQRTT